MTRAIVALAFGVLVLGFLVIRLTKEEPPPPRQWVERPATKAVAVAVSQESEPAPPDSLFPLPGDPDEVALRATPQEPLPGGVVEAILAYGTGDLDRAVELLTATGAEGAPEAIRRVYLGSALARLGRPEEALDALAPASDGTLPEPWRGEAAWTRAIALREAGRAADATAALEDLVAGEGPLADRARRLLAAGTR